MKRVITEKRPEYRVEAEGLLRNFREDLDIEGLKEVRILNVYYVEGLNDSELNSCLNVVFSEPSIDTVRVGEFEIPEGVRVLAMRYLPGQYDQRADSAEQAVRILTGKDAKVRAMKVLIITGDISDEDFNSIKAYMINPTDMEEASLIMPDSLKDTEFFPNKPPIYDDFRTLSDDEFEAFLEKHNLAMSLEDIKLIQKYFKNEEDRDPTETEIKMLDTYWSDHCRHTTFNTELTGVKFSGTTPLARSFSEYLSLRNEVYGDNPKPISLMDMGTLAAKAQRKRGLLDDQEISGEINACSIEIEVDHNGEKEPWLLMFKNETHNHPTEVEPFGGAATCLGGAIRDPLSGRSYVYQSMRITGSGDPNTPISETLPGKIPQRKLTRTAAAGFSSYGNQVGLATGKVREHYHPGYVAKRLELGAVIGAVRKDMVRREEPVAGDVVILLGGLTGRDGIGGATGSSKGQDTASLVNSGAEVQKGNPPEERKLLRFFRDPKATKLIKKSNDFGAGGVSVAIGELASGLEIDLDKVPLKYGGVSGTEIALSESQERMAVVVEEKDAKEFIELANKENLKATVVAEVVDTGRLRMHFQGETIVDISRDFIDTNGAKSSQAAKLSFHVPEDYFVTEPGDIREKWFEVMSRLNGASQKGLKDRFDFSVGAATVLAPLGGEYQLSNEEGMVAKIPVEDGETTTCSAMACGFYPHLSEKSAYHGAVYAVVNSICKLICYGVDPSKIRLTFQEYFGKLRREPKKWGIAVSAMLGALTAQMELHAPAIGGKDSMSGTFEDIDVPPTFVSFAVGVASIDKVNTTALQGKGSSLYLLETPLDEDKLPDYELLKEHLKLVAGKKFKALSTVRHGGIAETLSNMAFGNRIGFRVDVPEEKLFVHMSGSFIAESDEPLEGFIKIGETTDDAKIHYKDIEIDLVELQEAWLGTLSEVFPTDDGLEKPEVETISYDKGVAIKGETFAKPKVLVLALPGTNSEYDTKNAFLRAGGDAEIFLFRNRKSNEIKESIEALKNEIEKSQILVIPGGFSAGDEPEGSGKFIATVFRNPIIKEAVEGLLENRDGLMMGICNGFQTLIKLGLLPYGKIIDLDENSPTLTYNSIGRHQSAMVNVRVASNLSPWHSEMNVGEIYKMPISHGEGRFIVNDELAKKLIDNGQIAAQYVDGEGKATMDIRYNPSGSMLALESLTDPTGRILGKMGHAERVTFGTYQNIPNVKMQPVFLGGINYFK